MPQCNHHTEFDGVDSAYKRRLWLVIGLNALMFLVEISTGNLAQSQSLQADALDFLGDALTYGLSLAVIGLSVRIRAGAAMAKALSLLLMGLWVCLSTAMRFISDDIPDANIMGVVGFAALLANLASVRILASYKDGDANVRSVWLCSRNDAIGNVAVMVAAVGVWGSATQWPDLVVALIMAVLFVSSAVQIFMQALREWGKSPHSVTPPLR
ncbi:MAG: cation transporter [Burkholderiaceae bacterium]